MIHFKYRVSDLFCVSAKSFFPPFHHIQHILNRNIHVMHTISSSKNHFFSQWYNEIFLEQTSSCVCLISSLPSAAADPLASHEVQARLRSPLLRRGGSSRSGQRHRGGDRPQTVFCLVRQERERPERRIHCSWSEGALPRLRELLTKTTYPRGFGAEMVLYVL